LFALLPDNPLHAIHPANPAVNLS